MNIPATVIAWLALAVSIIAGIFSFTAGRSGGGEMAAIQKQVADLSARVEAIKPADVSAIEKQVSELATKVDAAKPFDASGLEKQVADLTAKLDAVKPYDPAPLQAKLDDLDKKISAVPAPETFDPSPLQARIDEVAGKIASMPAPQQFDPEPLKKAIEELGAKVAAVESADPGALQGRIDDLGKRVAALKPFDPSSLQQKLDALAATIAEQEGKSASSSVGTQKLLGQVFFNTNSSRLTDDAKLTLDGWIAALAGKPHRLAILGFADRVGRPEYNVALSISRAATVRGYLLRGGLAEGSVVVSAGGYGEEGTPVTTDDNIDEPQNRTVQVYVYE